MPSADTREPLPISALNHLLYCERRAALVHLEQAWADNRFTAEGNVLHETAHSGADKSQRGMRITRALPLVSVVHAMTGEADVVEFPKNGDVVPVEYKRGKPKLHRADEVQLCAQALCLEEMLNVTIPTGCLFYGEIRRRTAVTFDEELRAVTIRAIERLHELIASRVTPLAVREKKCDKCSLLEICLPDAMRFKRGAAAWFSTQLTIHQTAFTGESSS
ncbi:MAG: CRISPR-associated protein Cas4 [Akkermansiaceae bacterium]